MNGGIAPNPTGSIDGTVANLSFTLFHDTLSTLLILKSGDRLLVCGQSAVVILIVCPLARIKRPSVLAVGIDPTSFAATVNG
jgi:hypothetical protein